MSHASLTRPNMAGKVVHGCNLSSSFFLISFSIGDIVLLLLTGVVVHIL